MITAYFLSNFFIPSLATVYSLVTCDCVNHKYREQRYRKSKCVYLHSLRSTTVQKQRNNCRMKTICQKDELNALNKK